MLHKIVCDPKRFKKLPYAAKLAGVKIGEVFQAAGEIHVELNARTPDNLIALGKYEHVATDAEVEAFEKAEKAKGEKK